MKVSNYDVAAAAMSAMGEATIAKALSVSLYEAFIEVEPAQKERIIERTREIFSDSVNSTLNTELNLSNEFKEHLKKVPLPFENH